MTVISTSRSSLPGVPGSSDSSTLYVAEPKLTVKGPGSMMGRMYLLGVPSVTRSGSVPKVNSTNSVSSTTLSSIIFMLKCVTVCPGWKTTFAGTPE